jgi:hypothetical protein
MVRRSVRSRSAPSSSADERPGVGHHDDLGGGRGGDDQVGERAQQARLQAGLRLVEDEQGGRAWGEQCGGPQQIAQGAVGKLRGAQRAEQSVLVQGDLEPAGVVDDVDAATGKRRVDRGVEGRVVADLADRLRGGREVGAIVAEDRGAGADVSGAGRRLGVGAHVVVEAPGPDLLAQPEQVGRALRVGVLAEHAVVRAAATPGTGWTCPCRWRR